MLFEIHFDYQRRNSMYTYTQTHFPMVLDGLDGLYPQHSRSYCNTFKDIVIDEMTYNLEFQSNRFLAAKAAEQLLPSI